MDLRFTGGALLCEWSNVCNGSLQSSLAAPSEVAIDALDDTGNAQQMVIYQS